jgi:hypothetical protein
MRCGGENVVEAVDEIFFLVCQYYIGNQDINTGEHIEERFKSPFIVWFSFFMKESKGHTEGFVISCDASNVEEGNP